MPVLAAFLSINRFLCQDELPFWEPRVRSVVLWLRTFSVPGC